MIDVDAFTHNGFAKLKQAAPREVADAARALLWRQIDQSPDEPDNWTSPVVWAADLTGAGPFGELLRCPDLAAALDAVCGCGDWTPRGALGQIPVRFPVRPAADDRGWHIDLNTALPNGSWVVTGRPHTMLLLTLLSEVGSDDAPTRIRVGSHRHTATLLAEAPVDFAEAGRMLDAATSECPLALATGQPGDMYLVHPFTVHAANEHRGSTPRFMSQAPIVLTEPLGPQSSSVLADVWRP